MHPAGESPARVSTNNAAWYAQRPPGTAYGPARPGIHGERSRPPPWHRLSLPAREVASVRSG